MYSTVFLLKAQTTTKTKTQLKNKVKKNQKNIRKMRKSVSENKVKKLVKTPEEVKKLPGGVPCTVRITPQA
jgi:uncharacterized membrane protein (DUF106 family)